VNDEILKKLNQMPLIDFIEKLTIINKKGQKQSLILNAEQKEILKSLDSDADSLILKARQIGSTTIISAFLFAKAYLTQDEITFAVLSHKLASSKQILKMHKSFYYNLPKALQRELEQDNATEFKFLNGGRILAVASTQTEGLRSFTANRIHISEYAFADNPEELKATAISAVNEGQIIIESTANYYNDCLHREIMRQQLGQVEYNYLFFPWFQHKEYSLKATEHLGELTEYEDYLIQRFGVNKEQIAWRRRKVGKLGLDKFTREYPVDLDEAYRIAGTTYFSFEDFEEIEILPHDGEEWWISEDPQPNHSYAIGVDVGGGVNRDYSVIFCVNKITNQPVCIWRSNQVSPIRIADFIFEISERYNSALVLVEANSFGLATINELGHQGCHQLWKEGDKDFLTTAKTKPLVFENLKKNIQLGKIRLLDSTTSAQLRTIGTDEKGRIKFLDSDAEGHSDSAMAMALAYWCLESVTIKKDLYLPQWVRDKRAKRIIDNAGVGVKNHRRYL